MRLCLLLDPQSLGVVSIWTLEKPGIVSDVLKWKSRAPTFPFLSSHDVLVLRPSLVLRCLPFRSELAFSVDIALLVEAVAIVEVVEIVGALEIVVVAKLGAFLGQEFGLSRDLVLTIALPPCSVSMYLPSRPVFAALVETA
jgi:hypothetical protein